MAEVRTLLIGGEWVEGADGAYEVVNPATEEIVGLAPEASVAAGERRRRAPHARRSRRGRARSPRSAPSCCAPRRRAIRAHAEELVPLVIAETGCTAALGRSMQVPQAAVRFDRYAVGALEPTVIPLPPTEMPTTALAPGGHHGRDRAAHPRRCRRLHHALQLPDRQHGRQARPRARDGQHGDRATGVARPARGHRPLPHPQRRRLPARCHQLRHRLDPGDRRGARRLRATST